MPVFIASFGGHYLGGDAVIVAKTKRKAANSLNKELAKEGLGPVTSDDLTELDTENPQVIIQDNGNY